MENKELYEAIKNLDGLKYTGGITDEQVTAAERELDLKFATEYVAYLKKYGQLEARGIELTGISNKITTSVVRATLTLRRMSKIPSKMYVIEDLGIDGIEYLQTENGEIFQFRNGYTIPYASSLLNYINESSNN